MRLTKLRVAAAATGIGSARHGGLLGSPPTRRSSCYAKSGHLLLRQPVQRTDEADSREQHERRSGPRQDGGAAPDHLQLLPVLRHGPAALWRQQHLVPHLRRRHPQVGLRRAVNVWTSKDPFPGLATADAGEAGNGRRRAARCRPQRIVTSSGSGQQPGVSRAARRRRDRVDLTRVTAIGPPRSTWEPRPGPHRTSQAPSGRAGGRGSPCVVRVNASSSPSR